MNKQMVMALMLVLTCAFLAQAQLRTFMSAKGSNNAALLPTSKATESVAGPNSYKPSAELTASGVGLAIPACKNCPYILENCENNGWKPKAVCDACARGYCYNGDN